MSRLAKAFFIVVGLANICFGQSNSHNSYRSIINAIPIKVPVEQLKNGAVYVMTNQPQNAVLAFQRDTEKGSLTPIGSFLTGGSGDLNIQPGDYSVDLLGSQNSLVINNEYELLFAVNAGSNEISVFRLNGQTPQLIQVISSNGVRPISLATRGALLYVLNEGEKTNISGFSIASGGMLSPIAESTRGLAGGDVADPGAIVISDDGSLLFVTEKDTDRIDSFVLDTSGKPEQQFETISNGATPFGADFSRGFLVVAEAFDNQWGVSGVSSYAAGSSGVLSLTSPSVRNFQQSAGRILVSHDGIFAFVSNTLSESVSVFTLKDGGFLGLQEAAAAQVGFHTWPTDVALSNNGRFLYILRSGTHDIGVWQVGTNGYLKEAGSFGKLPTGSQGIVAR